MDQVIEESTEETLTASQTGRRSVLGFGTILILGLLLIFGRQMSLNDRGPVDTGLAPDFTLSLFDGGQLMLSELQGQVIVVNFWASWCIPCRDEAPVLEKAWRRYRDQDVLFIGVAYLDTGETVN